MRVDNCCRGQSRKLVFPKDFIKILNFKAIMVIIAKYLNKSGNYKRQPKVVRVVYKVIHGLENESKWVKTAIVNRIRKCKYEGKEGRV